MLIVNLQKTIEKVVLGGGIASKAPNSLELTDNELSALFNALLLTTRKAGRKHGKTANGAIHLINNIHGTC